MTDILCMNTFKRKNTLKGCCGNLQADILKEWNKFLLEELFFLKMIS